jgi:hypothetical protein
MIKCLTSFTYFSVHTFRLFMSHEHMRINSMHATDTKVPWLHSLFNLRVFYLKRNINWKISYCRESVGKCYIPQTN